MDRLDLMDPDLFRSGVPYDYFAWLRRHDPVAWHDEPAETGGRGYWLVTRHDDVVAANRDWQTYSNALRGSSLEDPRSDEELAFRQRIFVNQDPDDHTRTRRLVSPAFTPGRVRQFAGLARDVARRTVDRLLDEGRGDFHDGCATPMGFEVPAAMFGIPADDHDRMLEWSLMISLAQEPELNPSGKPRPEIQMVAVDYARELFARVRRDPDAHPGIAADLVRSEIVRPDGTVDRMTDDELALFVLVTVVGGVGTVAHTLSEAVSAFVERPQLLDELHRVLELGGPDAECPATLVEECVRWASPAMNFRRTATVDHELRGQQIKAGDKVVLSFSSANRDERVFADPDRLDPWRSPNDHVGFGGGGPHFCIGAQVGRMEVRSMLTEVVRRVARFELDGDPVRLRANQFAGFLHYPVRAVAR